MSRETFNKLCTKLIESPVMQSFEKLQPGITTDVIDLLKTKVKEDADG